VLQPASTGATVGG